MQPVLTSEQHWVLTNARFDKPIFAAPAMRIETGQGGHFVGNSATVESLVRRGLLVEDGKCGYLLTDNGAIARDTCRIRS